MRMQGFLSFPLLPSPGMPELVHRGSPFAQVPGACEKSALHLRSLFLVRRAAASGAGWAPHGFAQEPVCEAG